jgi:hypothetical protein
MPPPGGGPRVAPGRFGVGQALCHTDELTERWGRHLVAPEQLEAKLTRGAQWPGESRARRGTSRGAEPDRLAPEHCTEECASGTAAHRHRRDAELDQGVGHVTVVARSVAVARDDDVLTLELVSSDRAQPTEAMTRCSEDDQRLGRELDPLELRRSED